MERNEKITVSIIAIGLALLLASVLSYFSVLSIMAPKPVLIGGTAVLFVSLIYLLIKIFKRP